MRSLSSLQNDKQENHYLIVGLGNPGGGYQYTRHNLGFLVVQALAQARGLSFRHSSDLIGELAKGEVGGKKLFILQPATYMNSSGDAVRRCIDYYRVPIENMIIVCDDVALNLGTMRIRARGSDGGHNGLKSIAAHLRTQYYARLRIGVGAPGQAQLADYVLGRFTAEERVTVATMVEKARHVLELWISQGVAAAMQEANKEDNKNLET
jgi:PTH1 family peptidyl-tRNA hydrolase